MRSDSTTAVLAGYPGRLAGTDIERRAANEHASRLAAAGFDPLVEPIFTRPEWASSYALHGLGGLLASLVVVADPLTGTIVAFAVAISMLAEIALGRSPLRALTPRRASQCVSSDPETGAGGRTIILTAAYDQPREGRVAVGPLASAVLAAPLLGLFALAGLRLLEFESAALPVVQFAFSVVLIAAVPLLVEARLADPAEDDQGMAGGTVLAVAADLRGRGAGVRVLLAGSAARIPDGGRAWARAHRDELDRARTVVIEVIAPVSPTVDEVYLAREGPLAARVPVQAVADACRAAGLVGRRAGGQGTAAVFAARGFPAVAVTLGDPGRIADLAVALDAAATPIPA